MKKPLHPGWYGIEKQSNKGDEMKLKFNRSPAWIPADYDTIIPNGGGYYFGITNTQGPIGWRADILSKDLMTILTSHIASSNTKHGLISRLQRLLSADYTRLLASIMKTLETKGG